MKLAQSLMAHKWQSWNLNSKAPWKGKGANVPKGHPKGRHLAYRWQAMSSVECVVVQGGGAGGYGLALRIDPGICWHWPVKHQVFPTK